MRSLTEYDDIFYKQSHKKRARWFALASKITVVVYLCDGSNRYIPTEIIASHAAKTYPEFFVTMIDGRKVPDTYPVVKALEKAMGRGWRYIRGDWVQGWTLTKRGLQFSEEVKAIKNR
ncbi:MAG: hypothetical protein ACE5JU_05270 [Candidatus Binatia bacterium]